MPPTPPRAAFFSHPRSAVNVKSHKRQKISPNVTPFLPLPFLLWLEVKEKDASANSSPLSPSFLTNPCKLDVLQTWCARWERAARDAVWKRPGTDWKTHLAGDLDEPSADHHLSQANLKRESSTTGNQTHTKVRLETSENVYFIEEKHSVLFVPLPHASLSEIFSPALIEQMLKQLS